MSKSWKANSKTVIRGTDKRKSESQKEHENARNLIRQITRRTGEKIEAFLD
jgi:hypothetical protein